MINRFKVQWFGTIALAAIIGLQPIPAQPHDPSPQKQATDLLPRPAVPAAPDPVRTPPAESGTIWSGDNPPPTEVDIRYGPADRNVLDFWRPREPGPNPLVIYIHGGGFTESDKANFRQDPLIKACLDAGIAFAAINYRYLAADVPLQDILHDCARALQFLRSRAEELGIDPHRIAAFGSSAGAGTSMWLAFHDDMADPANPDPVLRGSTRLVCAGSLSGQCSYNWRRWQEIFESDAIKKYGGHYGAPQMLGFSTAADLETPAGLAVLADLDFINLISPDDPPVFIANQRSSLAVDSVGQFLHHPRHSILLYERCREQGVPVVARIPAYGITPAASEPASLKDFLFAHLTTR